MGGTGGMGGHAGCPRTLVCRPATGAGATGRGQRVRPQPKETSITTDAPDASGPDESAPETSIGHPRQPDAVAVSDEQDGTEPTPVAPADAHPPVDVSHVTAIDPDTGEAVGPGAVTHAPDEVPAPDTDHPRTPLVDGDARAEEAAFEAAASPEPSGPTPPAVTQAEAEAADPGRDLDPTAGADGNPGADLVAPGETSGPVGSGARDAAHASDNASAPEDERKSDDPAAPTDQGVADDATAPDGKDVSDLASAPADDSSADRVGATDEDATGADVDALDGDAPDGGAPDGDAPGEGDGPGDADGPTFADLGLRPELVEALAGLGYEEPTPIQREAIPPLLDGHDLLGQAATGTGKTAAFALPILQQLGRAERDPRPTALVLVPTRELAIQVSEAVHRYGRPLGARVLPIYGGQPIFRQLRALESGVDVVVATPGRAIDHIGRRSLVLSSVATVVLDEADEMLDMGFAEDIDAILDQAPDERQTVLFSATIPARIQAIARRHLDDAVRIQMGGATTAEGEAPLVRQTAYIVTRPHKATALGRILDVESPTAAIVFCRTRAEVDQLTDTLNGRGYRAEALHGGMDQTQRDRVMGRVRSGAADLLVATDVAARGLDIDQLTHVVNYDVPSSPDAYVHRIGRVGRAGREGVAITLAGPREHRQLKTIERVTKQRIAVEQVPSVADLRTRRLELTRAALHELLVEDDLDQSRVVVESLTDEFDLMEVALAAVKLAHEARGGADDDEQDIPEVAVRPDWKTKDKSGPFKPGAGKGGRRGPQGPVTKVFIGAGRATGIRPQDLVGAITGESRLGGRDIGAIQIADKFSLVEVPADAADEVVAALRGSTIKGKKTTVRRDRSGGT